MTKIFCKLSWSKIVLFSCIVFAADNNDEKQETLPKCLFDITLKFGVKLRFSNSASIGQEEQRYEIDWRSQIPLPKLTRETDALIIQNARTLNNHLIRNTSFWDFHLSLFWRHQPRDRKDSILPAIWENAASIYWQKRRNKSHLNRDKSTHKVFYCQSYQLSAAKDKRSWALDFTNLQERCTGKSNFSKRKIISYQTKLTKQKEDL